MSPCTFSLLITIRLREIRPVLCCVRCVADSGPPFESLRTLMYTGVVTFVVLLLIMFVLLSSVPSVVRESMH